jgi:hypothetical protein
MGKPLSRASDGGQIDISRGRQDVTQGELPQGPETEVLLLKKVRPEALPTGSPMSVLLTFCNIWVYSMLPSVNVNLYFRALRAGSRGSGPRESLRTEPADKEKRPNRKGDGDKKV